MTETPPAGSRPAVARTSKTDIIVLIAVLGFYAAALYHYALGVYGQRPYPENTFLFRPENRFADFFNGFHFVGAHLDTVTPLHNPFAYVLGAAFAQIPPIPSFLLFQLVFVAVLAHGCLVHMAGASRLQTLRNALVLTFFSYPVIFCLDRANNETWVFIFLYLFLIAYYTRPAWSTAALSLAVAMKPFPGVFVALYAADRKYRRLRALLVAVAAITFISILVIWHAGCDPLRFAHRYLQDVQSYQKVYAIEDEGLHFNHSLWGVYKVAAAVAADRLGAGAEGLRAAVTRASRWYTLFSLLGFALAFFYAWRWEKVLWRQVAVLVCAMNLLPQVSGDYKLIHLYLPMFLFARDQRMMRNDGAFAAIFGLLLIPKAYWPGLPLDSPEASLSVVINPLLMVALVALIVVTTIQERVRPDETC